MIKIIRFFIPFVILGIIILYIPHFFDVNLNDYRTAEHHIKYENAYPLNQEYYNALGKINNFQIKNIKIKQVYIGTEDNIIKDNSTLPYSGADIFNNIPAVIKEHIPSVIKEYIPSVIKEYISSASSFWEYLNNFSTYLIFLATAFVGWVGYRIQKRSNFQNEFDTLFSEHEKVLKEVFFNDNTREFNARTKQILYKLTIKYINGNDCSYPNGYRTYVREIFDKDYETKSYFILLYRLLKAINERGGNSKKDYTSIVRACIPPEILFLISLNAFSGDYDVYKEYRIYISKAHFLEHLPFDYSFFYRIYRMYCTVNRNTKKLFELNDEDFYNFMGMMLERFYEEGFIKNKIILLYKGYSPIFGNNIYIKNFLENMNFSYFPCGTIARTLKYFFNIISIYIFIPIFVFIFNIKFNLFRYILNQDYLGIIFYSIVNIIFISLIIKKIYYAFSRDRYNDENIKFKDRQRCIFKIYLFLKDKLSACFD